MSYAKQLFAPLWANRVPVKWIPAIRNKAVLSSAQTFTCITRVAVKKILNLFCV